MFGPGVEGIRESQAGVERTPARQRVQRVLVAGLKEAPFEAQPPLVLRGGVEDGGDLIRLIEKDERAVVDRPRRLVRMTVVYDLATRRKLDQPPELVAVGTAEVPHAARDLTL